MKKTGLVVSFARSMSLFVLGGSLFVSACTKKFPDINKDPNAITNPELEQLFTYSLYKMGSYQYGEWFYDNYQYVMPMIQQVVPLFGNEAEMNQIYNTGGRYRSFYREIMPNLVEIRNRIEKMNSADVTAFYKLYHVTNVLQVMHGIKVMDVYGSLIYRESMNGRCQLDFTMPYDTQEQLFEIWYNQLNMAIRVLLKKTDEVQKSLGGYDFVYSGNWALWARFANSLKLRLAVRLEHADSFFMKEIIDEAWNNPAGLMTRTDQEFWWSPEFRYSGPAYDIPNQCVAARSFLEMLKKSHDPRALWFFEPNEFDQKQLELMRQSQLPIPGIIPDTIESVWDRFLGGPVEPDSSSLKDYFEVFRDNKNDRVWQLSRLNRFLFAPKTNNRNGEYVDVMFSAAEVCFYLSEFVEKGYLNDDAQYWYEKGIQCSMRSYWKMAQKADIPFLDSSTLTSAKMDAYIQDPFFKWDVGGDNLEKIYLQQYINFFKLPNENYTLVRRTGIPFRKSQLLPWHPFLLSGEELVLPRRWPVLSPSVTTNSFYFNQAMQEQGFTLGAVDSETLNRERVWWDINSPDFGGE